MGNKAVVPYGCLHVKEPCLHRERLQFPRTLLKKFLDYETDNGGTNKMQCMVAAWHRLHQNSKKNVYFSSINLLQAQFTPSPWGFFFPSRKRRNNSLRDNEHFRKNRLYQTKLPIPTSLTNHVSPLRKSPSQTNKRLLEHSSSPKRRVLMDGQILAREEEEEEEEEIGEKVGR